MDTPGEAWRRLIEGAFGRARVLIVGDLMLDAYLWGDVGRISPEAPVPILRLARRSEAAGGAGNVALNLASLGLGVTVAGFVGGDEAGLRLRRLLEGAGVEARVVRAGDGRPTVTKTRVVGGRQQMLRIDEEGSGSLPQADQERLIAASLPLISGGMAAVVLSDYDKGGMTPLVCRALIDEARRAGVPIVVDPKGRDFAKYAHATGLTPNHREFEIALGVDGLAEPALRDAARRLREELGLDFLAVTRGERGVSLFEAQAERDIPAVAREVFDVSGAGDTLIATLAAGLAGGLDPGPALQLANVAAGVVVGKVGTAAIRRVELLAAVAADPLGSQDRKVCDLDTLLERTARWRGLGERVVFTNGCFDLLHVGHVTLLARARAEGDRLVVGLNTDRSVRGLKGEGRPAVPQADRARVLAGLAAVDAVVLFDEETPLRLIEALRPEVLVKGADYAETEIAGADRVRSRGGAVVLIPLVEGQSTTRLLGRKP